MPETAVGYLRLSQDGKSLDRQQRDVESYAAKSGYELVEIYNEGRRASGFDGDRPEYTALLEHVEAGGVDAVLVPNLSRLSRDRKERLRLLLALDVEDRVALPVRDEYPDEMHAVPRWPRPRSNVAHTGVRCSLGPFNRGF